MDISNIVKGFLLCVLLGFVGLANASFKSVIKDPYVKMYYGCFDSKIKLYRLCDFKQYLEHKNKKVKFCYDENYGQRVSCKKYNMEVDV